MRWYRDASSRRPGGILGDALALARDAKEPGKIVSRDYDA
jgi:hypothetical protein